MCILYIYIYIQLLRIPATVPLQLQSVLCLKSDHQKSMKYRAERPPFFLNNIELHFVKKTHGKSRTIAPKIMKNIDKNTKFLSQNHEKLVRGVSLWLLGRPLGPQGRQRRKSEPKGGSLDPPPPPPQEGPQSGPKMGTFFFWSLRDTKKGGPGRPSRIGPFFGRCWGLPGGPQEGSRLDGSSPTTPVRTPPKIRSPKKHEIQGGTLAIFFLKNIELYFVKKTRKITNNCS